MINLTIKKEHRKDCTEAQEHLDGEVKLQNDVYPNWTWFLLLYAHFVNGVDKYEIADWYERQGCERSFILRVLSSKSGKDTSRLVVIRNNFKSWYHRWYNKSPFKKYACPPDKKKKKEEGGFGL